MRARRHITARECITRFASRLTLAEMAAQFGLKEDTLRRTANKMGVEVRRAKHQKSPAPEPIDRFLMLAA